MKLTNSAKNIIDRVDTRNLNNNTQRVLLQMIRGGEWVERTALKVTNPSSRIRDLRTPQFGGFRIECRSARDLGKGTESNRTFYRLDPKTVTVARLNRIFEGVMSNS